MPDAETEVPHFRILQPEDRKRVQLYLRAVDLMGEVTRAFTEWQDAGKHPDITPEQRAESEREVAAAIDRLDFEGMGKKFPSAETIRLYALEEILAQISELRSDVAALKEGMERGW